MCYRERHTLDAGDETMEQQTFAEITFELYRNWTRIRG